MSPWNVKFPQKHTDTVLRVLYTTWMGVRHKMVPGNTIHSHSCLMEVSVLLVTLVWRLPTCMVSLLSPAYIRICVVRLLERENDLEHGAHVHRACQA